MQQDDESASELAGELAGEGGVTVNGEFPSTLPLTLLACTALPGTAL